MYTSISSGGTYLSHTHLSNLVVLASVLLLAVVARGAFCGWICPLGAIQEWLYAASSWAQKRIRPLGRTVRVLKAWAGIQPVHRFDQRGAPTLIERIDHWLRYLKYVVLAWVLLGTAGYGYLVFRDYEPWSALLTITELELTGGLIVLAVVLVAALFVERPWCRYACPLGVVIGIASKVSPLHIQRDGPVCAGCALCNKTCPVGIPVDTRTDITDASCITGIVNLPISGTLWYHRSHDITIILAHLQALSLPCRDYPSRGLALVSILSQLSRRGRTAGSAHHRAHV